MENNKMLVETLEGFGTAIHYHYKKKIRRIYRWFLLGIAIAFVLGGLIYGIVTGEALNWIM